MLRYTTQFVIGLINATRFVIWKIPLYKTKNLLKAQQWSPSKSVEANEERVLDIFLIIYSRM